MIKFIRLWLLVLLIFFLAQFAYNKEVLAVNCQTYYTSGDSCGLAETPSRNVCTDGPQCPTNQYQCTAGSLTNFTGPNAFTSAVSKCSQCSGCCELWFSGDVISACFVEVGAATPTPPPPGTCPGKEGAACCASLPSCEVGLNCCGGICSVTACITPVVTATPIPYNPCNGVPAAANGACTSCVSGGGAYTALGCIPTGSGTDFAASVLKILFAIAGGIAFLLMIYGAFICITSRGDPQKAQACRETITSAIVGLLMLLFALLIVRVIFGPGGFIPGLITGVL